jgi:hypothetical protein
MTKRSSALIRTRRTSVSVSDVEQIRDCASSLYALALKARDNNLDDYAAQLEELAAEASAHAERLNSEVQKRSGQQQQQPQPNKSQ